jgi:DNA mismatch repair protein MutS
MTQAMSTAIYDEYEKYLVKYKNECGDNTVVLMQVGSFYEIYSVDNGLIDLRQIADILGIQITRKNKSILEVSKKNCMLAGFPDHALEKYISILVDNNYTVVVVSQVSKPPKPKRAVTHIRSPGTKINQIEPYENNFLMSIYLDEFKDMRSQAYILSIGLAYIDLSTGNSYVFETSSKPNDPLYALDETFRIITATNPKEFVITGNIKHITDIEIIRHLELEGKYVHNLINDYDETFKKLSWQRQFLTKCFPNHGLLSPAEYINMERMVFALPAYIQLLQFAYKHSDTILSKINKPIIIDDNNVVTLSYNTATQLNIISHDKSSLSLTQILNVAKTAFGRRRFREKLLNPSFDVKYLENEYDKVQYLIDNKLINTIGTLLSSICDIERYSRKIFMKTLHPSDFVSIHSSLQSCVKILELFEFERDKHDSIIYNIKTLISKLNVSLNFDEIAKHHIDNITANIFNKGLFPDLDEIQNDIDIIHNFFVKVCEVFNEQNPNFFKLENTEKDGYSIIVTSKRFETYRKTNNFIKIDDITINITELEPHKISASSSTVRLSCPFFKEMNTKYAETQLKIKEYTTKHYLEFLESIGNEFHSTINGVIEVISNIDISNTNAYNAVKYNYCRPSISNKYASKPFISAQQIRHPIIEIIQEHQQYIPNDIELGIPGQDGILLYGVNASGKSSLMKSAGLSVIMASAGMYVPCKTFVFYPYKFIFSRIPTGDNISKGQSTFTNEVSELRDILKRANNNSLVIGDELCSGTEHISAMSIVASGIIRLCNRNASFIFATHLHDIINISSIKALTNLKVFHLSVLYDEAHKKLIYDRILQSGQGYRLYGLEVMRGLAMDNEFIENANTIRMELLNKEPNIVSTKQSKYNAKLYKDVCVVCQQPASDVHHIKEQHLSDEHGFIEHYHKNSLFNLINLCKICHDKVHNGELVIDKFIQTTNGVELQVM